MRLLKRILAYNWKYYLLAVFCFAAFWHSFSAITLLRQTERELISSLRQNAFLLEQAILQNDVVKAKQVLWQLKGDRIRRLVFHSNLSSESDRIFRELIIGPPATSVAASARHHRVIVNGAEIGRLEWTIDYLELNSSVLTDNAALFATVTAFFSLLMVLSNIGAMRTLIRLEESVSAANRLIAQGAQSSLQDKIAAQMKLVPQEGIGAPFTALMGQVIEVLQQASRKETELALSTALSDAAAQVAHDIRSPLTALEVVAAESDHLPEEKRALIRAAIGRMRGIADGMLERYRGRGEEGAGKEALSIQPLALLLDSILAEKKLQCRPNASVSLDAAFDPSSSAALAAVAPGEFKRLMSNLLNNAVESFDEGGGAVTVSLSARDGRALIGVTDDGKGIPPDVLSRLGQRGETHGKAGGTGLGLHHARACAESWGGRLDIASEPGKGTSVTVSLPLAAAPPDLEGDLYDAVLIDDDALARATWRMTAERLGKRLRAFATAAEFFQAAGEIDRRTPVYVDSDLGEGVRGEEESRRIHELGFAKIYMATGHPASSFSAHAHLSGVVGKEPPWPGAAA